MRNEFEAMNDFLSLETITTEDIPSTWTPFYRVIRVTVAYNYVVSR